MRTTLMSPDTLVSGPVDMWSRMTTSLPSPGTPWQVTSCPFQHHRAIDSHTAATAQFRGRMCGDCPATPLRADKIVSPHSRKRKETNDSTLEL